LVASEIKQNDFYFNEETGQFQWKPSFEYAQRHSTYALIFSATDNVHTIYDTIQVKVDPINYPPEIEPIRDREIREDEELIFQLSVKDKNGDENLKVSVAESDITDYTFDERKRQFRWKPDYDFVTNLDKKTVYLTFKVSDSIFEAEQTMKITVYDRENPALLQTSYIKNLHFARKIFAEVDTMDKKVTQSVKSKRHWNRVFDISNILVSTFVGIASSSLMSEKVQQSAVPIGATITALIGIRSVLDKSDRNLLDLKTQAVLLRGNMESAINYMVREYGENPNLSVTDTRRFKDDLNNFKEKIEFCDSQKEKMKAELSVNKL